MKKYWVSFNPRDLMFVRTMTSEDGVKYGLASVKLNDRDAISLFTNNINWSKKFGKFSFIIDGEKKYRLYNREGKTRFEVGGNELILILKENKKYKTLFIGKEVVERDLDTSKIEVVNDTV